MSSFSEKLQQATNEDKQVNELYKHELQKQFNKLKDDEWDCSLLTIDIDNPIYLHTDGIFECSYHNGEYGAYIPFYLLMECKLDKDFNIPEQKAEVILQAVAYLAQIYYSKFSTGHEANLAKNKFKLNEDALARIEKMPSTVFIGSKSTCFAISTEQLSRYYNRNLDFDSIKSASTYKNTPQGELVYKDILNDTMLDATSPVFNTSDKYCISDIAEIIYKYNKGIKDADDLSPKNLYRAFTRFTTRVLTAESVEQFTNRQQASLLAQFIVNRKAIKVETDLDGNIQGLAVNGVDVHVNKKEWNTFSWIYNLKEYADDEQRKITAITDQLIADDDRRRKGDFYTPSIWVDEAHKLLDKNLGENWRDEYMVWDCAWGTGNLTRDCTKLNGTFIRDLFCSTLHETDLEIAERYNTQATKFQYDFLNDDVDEMESIKTELARPLQFKAGINMSAMEPFLNFAKILDLYVMANEKGFMTIEEGQIAYNRAINILKGTKLYQSAPTLIDGLLGDDDHEPKKLLFLINPPYAGVGNMGNASSKGNKANSTDSQVSSLMKEEKVKGTNNLYMQFMYRIAIINRLFGSKIHLAIFCPADIMNNPTGKDIRTLYSNCGGFTDAFAFKASHFADVSDTWGIAFSIWTPTVNDKQIAIKDIDELGNIITTGYKHMDEVPTEKELLRNIKTAIKDDTEEIFRVTSGINIDTTHSYIRPIHSMGSCMMDTANVSSNQQRVNMVNTRTNGNWTIIDILDDNVMDVISAFSARRMIKSDWVNYQDKYMYPNKSNENYNQYESDAIVYSLFESKMQISALRGVKFNNKEWDMANEFFWMSVKDIANMATGRTSAEDINNDICNDIEQFGDNRFVYKKLQTVTLSPDAQAVLDKATELVKSSFKYRKQFNQAHPEYHINTWDAGWYQIKGMLKEYDPEGLKQFNELYKQLEDRMRPLVYELGFLYK